MITPKTTGQRIKQRHVGNQCLGNAFQLSHLKWTFIFEYLKQRGKSTQLNGTHDKVALIYRYFVRVSTALHVLYHRDLS